eukprot:768301-Pleurochrysis_carterae.AAC.7
MAPDDLADNEQLSWTALKQNGTIIRRADDDWGVDGASDAMNSSERLENPKVDPITGPGRTASMKAADTRAHHAAMREYARTHNCRPPIFQ